MKTFEIHDGGDWTLGVAEGDDELMQSITHLLYTRAGEWFLNLDHGLRRSVFEEKKAQRSEVVQAIYDCIYQEPRVTEISELDYEHNRLSRVLTVRFRLTADGDEIGGEVNVDVGRI